MTIYVLDREKKVIFQEKVLAEGLLRKIYGKKENLKNFLCKNSLFSHLVGMWQSMPWTRKNVDDFIQEYGINKEEFEKETFSSFNDFFIRKLKKEARPLAKSDVIIPADGRYLCFQDFSRADRLFVKGQKFSLSELLKDEELAKKYEDGTIIIARLAPPDYHRFHFPLTCTPSKPHLINGSLFSVSPIALRKNINYLTQNKRMLVRLKTEKYGEVLACAIGATSVGTIHFTYTPDETYQKGDEMGYFSFGGSMVIYLFEPKKIQLAKDLRDSDIEILCKMGQSLC